MTAEETPVITDEHEPATEPEAVDDATGEIVEKPTAADGLKAANAEAAARRKELRAAQAELNSSQGAVETLQRQVIESLLAAEADTDKRLHKSADLFDIGGVSAKDLTNDAGGIDQAKLGAALAMLKAERPYLFEQSPQDPLSSLMARMQDPRSVHSGASNAWNKALNQRQ